MLGRSNNAEPILISSEKKYDKGGSIENNDVKGVEVEIRLGIPGIEYNKINQVIMLTETEISTQNIIRELVNIQELIPTKL